MTERKSTGDIGRTNSDRRSQCAGLYWRNLGRKSEDRVVAGFDSGGAQMVRSYTVGTARKNAVVRAGRRSVDLR